MRSKSRKILRPSELALWKIIKMGAPNEMTKFVTMPWRICTRSSVVVPCKRNPRILMCRMRQVYLKPALLCAFIVPVSEEQ